MTSKEVKRKVAYETPLINLETSYTKDVLLESDSSKDDMNTWATEDFVNSLGGGASV